MQRWRGGSYAMFFFSMAGTMARRLHASFISSNIVLLLLPNIGSIATGWMRLMEQALVSKKVFGILSYVAAALV